MRLRSLNAGATVVRAQAMETATTPASGKNESLASKMGGSKAVIAAVVRIQACSSGPPSSAG